MVHYFRVLLRRWFGMVDYSEVRNAYERWLRSSQEWESDRRHFAQTGEALSRVVDRLERQNKDLVDRLTAMTLKAAIIDVAPIESMSRTKDALSGFRDSLVHSQNVDLAPLDQALMELEKGLTNIRVARGTDRC